MQPHEHMENHSEEQLDDGVSVHVKDLTNKTWFHQVFQKHAELQRTHVKCLESAVEKLLQIVGETAYFLFLHIRKVNTTFKAHWKHQRTL